MPGEHLSLSKSSLAYAKLAATPTDTAWSQVYNAGNLFACLSLTLAEEGEQPSSLQNFGKELFSNLETEFFTLEEKNPTTIKHAIEKSIKHIPDTIAINFCLSFFKDHILYLFLLGNGKVLMKRKEKIGVLLDKKEETGRDILTASGYLQNGDTLLLETDRFAKNISDNHILEALQLELPNDIAETLSVHMHEHGEGDQAAIIIIYHGVARPMPEPTESRLPEKVSEEQLDEQEPLPQREREPRNLPSFGSVASWLSSKLPFRGYNRHINLRLNHRKKIFLSIIAVILLLLFVSIFLTKQKQETSKTNELFTAVYTPALKSYDEGKGLQSINEDLSREDFRKAKQLLEDGKEKFSEGSKERKQIDELLSKIAAELGPDAQEQTAATAVKEVTVDDTDLLAVSKANSDGHGFSQDKDFVYYVTDKAAFSVNKSDGKKKELVKNDGDWEKAVAIAPYQGNFYVLDQKDGVLKYVSGSDGFGKSAYFKSAPDLSKAVSMAIDSSIWILFSDGNIKKYTRGEADSFSLKDFSTPLKNPTKLYTDPNITNVYILDAGNSRIVKLSTDGTFQKQYTAGIIKNARDFEIVDGEKKARILSGGKIWEIEL